MKCAIRDCPNDDSQETFEGPVCSLCYRYGRSYITLRDGIVQKKLLALQTWVDDEISFIEDDERFKDVPAQVQINAPLALIQMELRGNNILLKKLKGMLDK